jgi:hypothetical protein
MPRILLLWATLCGCVFDASYDGGHYTCSDGKCPSGLTCTANKCVVPGHDASTIDAVVVHDAHVPALTCADPGVAGATEHGATAGTGMISASCGGVIMNGPDAVYRLATVAGDHVTVTIAGSYAVDAYLIAPCTATPLCEGDVFAAAGVPLNLMPAAGDHFVVVDGINPSMSGTYTLTVIVTP